MQLLKYGSIKNLIVEKHKKDIKITFSVIKNLKKKTMRFFKGTFPLTKASRKVNKQYCKIFTFECPNMFQCNYPK